MKVNDALAFQKLKNEIIYIIRSESQIASLTPVAVSMQARFEQVSRSFGRHEAGDAYTPLSTRKSATFPGFNRATADERKDSPRPGSSASR